LASGFTAVLPASVRFLLALSVISWIPGAVLVGRFVRVPLGGPLEKAVLWFTAGLAATSLLTWPAVLVALPFSAYAVAVQWLLAVVFAGALVLDWKSPGSASAAPSDAAGVPASIGAGAQRILVAVAAVLAVVAMVAPPRLDLHQDSLDHIGYVRQVESENSLVPQGVLAQPVAFRGAAAPGGGEATKADPRKGTIHAIVALASRLSQADPVDAWRALPAVMFALAFLAFAWFCVSFLPHPGLVYACAALFLLFQGGIGVLHGREFANSQGVWLVYYWVLVPMTLRQVTAFDVAKLAALLIVFAGGALMHVGVAVHFLVLLATLLVFHRWLGLDRRAVVVTCAWGAFVAAVVLSWKLLTAAGAGNEIHAHAQGLMYVGRWFVVSPVEVLRQNGLVFFGGLAIVPFLFFFARKYPSARRQLAFAAIPFAVCFIPPLAPALYDVATYMLFRTLLNVPAFAVVTATFFWVAVWARRRGWVARVAAVLVLVVWAKVFLVPGVGAFERAYAAYQSERSDQSIVQRYEDVILFLRSRPDGSVVLSDPKTSYLLSAVTDHRVVAVLGQHGNPNDPRAYDRLAAVRDVLSPFVLHSITAEACEQWGVDFVVVNGRLGDAAPGFLDDWTGSMYAATRAKLMALPTRFRPVFETDDMTVFLYYPGSIPADTWLPERMPLRFQAAGLRRCSVRAPDEAFYISEVDVSPKRALPGETLLVRFGYEMQDMVPFGRPYVVYVRFDHESIAHDEGGYPMEKQVRRWRERKDGRLLRYRANHRPFGGIFQADRWPVGVVFYDFFEVKLPSTLEPGTYHVEFSIEQETLLPNFALRDFFYNRDHYSGTQCLEIEVAKQLVR